MYYEHSAHCMNVLYQSLFWTILKKAYLCTCWRSFNEPVEGCSSKPKEVLYNEVVIAGELTVFYLTLEGKSY